MDFDSARAEIEGYDDREFRAGLLLGFFGSYEIHEIPDSDLADEVEALRAEFGED